MATGRMEMVLNMDCLQCYGSISLWSQLEATAAYFVLSHNRILVYAPNKGSRVVSRLRYDLSHFTPSLITCRFILSPADGSGGP